MFFVFFYAICAVIGFVAESKSLSDSTKAVLGLLMLPLMLVGLIVQIKRWHDRDKSGWWVLINLVPCIGGLWALIECGFLRGTTGENRFGPDPLQQ